MIRLSQIAVLLRSKNEAKHEIAKKLSPVQLKFSTEMARNLAKQCEQVNIYVTERIGLEKVSLARTETPAQISSKREDHENDRNGKYGTEVGTT